MACTSSTICMGRSRSVSRVAGAPPRTSTPPTAGASQRMTVQPVPASRLVSCPTRMPGMSVMSSCITLIHLLYLFSVFSSNGAPKSCYGLGHALVLVINCGTGDEQIGSGLYDLWRCGFVNTPVYLYVTMQVALGDHLADTRDFGQHLRDEIL